jgi:phenylpropionate dioxygenase-like ring-hydroxylating dioxygenase large terminal subunit
MDAPTPEFALAGSLAELRAKGRLVVRGHRPILVLYDRGRVFALDNRCPHMSFPLDRGSVDDGILTCHWHHARFDLEMHLRPVGGRRADLPGRAAQRRSLGEDDVWVCRSSRALATAA